MVSIPASGDIMYFSSGEGNATDLYSVLTDLQPEAVITVSGTVMDATNKKPLSAKITIIDIELGRDTTIVKSNISDGKYMVILNKGKIYDVSVTADGYAFYSTRFDLKDLEAYQEIVRDILLEPIKTGTMLSLNIYFNFDSDSLIINTSKYELDRVIKLMNDHPTMIVEIGGHTDNIGSDEYNLDLSIRRAKSVINYLIKHGVKKDRLSAKGYGEKQPILNNNTEEGRSKNRRVEFEILHVDTFTNER